MISIHRQRGLRSVLLVILLSMVAMAGCRVLPDILPVAQSTPVSASGDAITVFFTDPYGTGRETRTGGPDADLAQAITAAAEQVDMAIYNLSAPDVLQALEAAHARGVAVRLVVDSTAINDNALEDLQSAGIPLVGDQRESTMHNKFTVIDGQEVWTGSANYTATSIYNDANNLVRIRSADLAQDYEAEFEEMFRDHQFSSDSPANTPEPVVEVDGKRVEVYFSPDDGVLEHLLPVVNGAQHSLHFLAYSFTSDPLGSALLDRYRAGVDVRGLMDAEQYQSNTGTEYDRFRQAGIDVRLDSIQGLMHHKVIVVDGQVVIFGSYNFSRNAETSNDENLLIVYSPAIAAQFEAEFERLYAASQ